MSESLKQRMAAEIREGSALIADKAGNESGMAEGLAMMAQDIAEAVREVLGESSDQVDKQMIEALSALTTAGKRAGEDLGDSAHRASGMTFESVPARWYNHKTHESGEFHRQLSRGPR